jgi:hypothetical protein
MHNYREDMEDVKSAYLMVKNSIEDDLTSSQEFMEALQFAGSIHDPIADEGHIDISTLLIRTEGVTFGEKQF